MPMRHVAPPPPMLVASARSMPQARDMRKVAVLPLPSPIDIFEPTDAGVILAITYSIREGRRSEFFDLMKELKPLLTAIGGNDCTVYEDRSRPSYFMEVFRFKDEAEFTAFDDKFHKDRKIAAVYTLLDDIVEAEKSDFKIFERRL
ncbi:MAG: MFS transporter [Vicinamibacteria bacterium]|nr:MFS transporter [Vicinamibacteria bacterium]